MTWHLSVSGDVRAPQGSAAHRVEEELLDDLRAVLSKPAYGTRVSLLRGQHVVSTSVHIPVPAPVAEPETPAPAPARARGKTTTARE